MTFDIQAFFAEVKAESAVLDTRRDEGGAIYLMSLTNRQKSTIGGRICVLRNENIAATHIVNGTHRAATPQEISAWKQQQAEEREAILAARRPPAQVPQTIIVQMPTNVQPGESVSVQLPTHHRKQTTRETQPAS
jgi:predicted Fe-S protein YdhL (DUF1289 family)